MEERIIEAIQRNFDGAVVDLNQDSGTQKLSGSLLWDGFAGHGFPWRQNRLYRVLRRELGPEATVISHIFTYTPNEYEQMMSMDQAAA